MLRWLKLASKVRRGLTGLHAGTKELIRPFFAKESEYTSFCAELDTREAQYRRLQHLLRTPEESELSGIPRLNSAKNLSGIQKGINTEVKAISGGGYQRNGDICYKKECRRRVRP